MTCICGHEWADHQIEEWVNNPPTAHECDLCECGQYEDPVEVESVPLFRGEGT